MGFPDPINCPDCVGSLTIGDVSLHTEAWCALDLSEWWASPDRRGSNVLIPASAGRSAREQIADETDVTTRMIFGGGYDQNGVRHVGLTARQGLAVNLDAFKSSVVALPGTDAGTRSAVLTKPDGNTVSGDVQVLKFDPRILPGGYARVVLRCRIVDGELS